MDEIIFRSVTPIFYFDLEPNDSIFTQDGSFKSKRDCTFTISLKKYELNQADFDELLKYTDEDVRKNLSNLIYTYEGFKVTEYFLVVDVTYPLADELQERGITTELMKIQGAILDSIRLHSCYAYHNSYYFRSISKSNTGKRNYHIIAPTTKHYIFNYAVDKPPILSVSEFDSCRSMFNILLNKEWRDDITFDRVLRLALEYHRMTFNVDPAEHRFLLLMIICDSLFKKESERNASQAAQRVSRLIATTQTHQKQIQQEFFDNAPNTFYKLRNSIAHGNPNLDRDVVISQYWTLYHYITKAIASLLFIPPGELNYTKDYYDEISRFVNKRFEGLPAS
jgi:hypothetical protein